MTGAAMAKRRPHRPEVPERMVDRGPDTEAQRWRTKSEPVTVKGITVLRKRHTLILDEMLNHKDKDGKRRPKITEGQHKAGKLLGEMHELKFTSPERNGIFVDVTPDWSAIAVNQLQRVWDFDALLAAVPKRHRRVVLHVCCEDRAIRDGLCRNGREADEAEEALRAGLTPLAKLLGY